MHVTACTRHRSDAVRGAQRHPSTMTSDRTAWHDEISDLRALMPPRPKPVMHLPPAPRRGARRAPKWLALAARRNGL